MNRKQLVETVAVAAQLKTEEAERLFDAVLEIITTALKAGETVRVSGFGKFDVVERRAMEIRSPRQEGWIDVGPTKRARFTPGVDLRQTLKGRASSAPVKSAAAQRSDDRYVQYNR